MHERENIIRILMETKAAIANDDATKLRELSNHTIHTASVHQDPSDIAVAVVVYSISKIIERKDYRQDPQWEKFLNNFKLCIDKSIKYAEKDDEKGFAMGIACVRKSINKLSGKLRVYIQDVFKRAEINKASRIYEHGISMEQTAKLLGVSMFDLANYAGQTGIANVSENKTIDVKTRIKTTMEMFG